MQSMLSYNPAKVRFELTHEDGDRVKLKEHFEQPEIRYRATKGVGYTNSKLSVVIPRAKFEIHYQFLNLYAERLLGF